MHPLRSRSLFVAIVFLGATDFTAAQDQRPYGFSQADAPAQLALEQRFDAALDAQQIGAWLQQLSSGANHVGAPHNKENAEFLLQQFKDWGWHAEIETYDALYPTPKRVALELVAPTTFTAKLSEPPIDGDATSQRTDGLPPYNVYGADGDVTGPLVYVNQGMDDDYKELARRGIDVKGAIVITRYGGGWRGHQTEARLRARRDRLPDLFGSQRRRLRDGRHVPERWLASGRRRAARLGARSDGSTPAIPSLPALARQRKRSACASRMQRHC